MVRLLQTEFHNLVVYRASADPKPFGGKGLVPMHVFKGLLIELTLVDIRLFCNPGKGIRPRWGIPLAEEVPAEGETETATIYDERGMALTSVDVHRTEISHGYGNMFMVPEPKPGWHAVAVAGAAPLPFPP